MLIYPISHHLTVFQRLFHTRSWLHFFIEGFILQSERLQNVWNVWAMRAFNDVKMNLIRAWYWNMELCSNLGTSTVCLWVFLKDRERHSDLSVLHAMLHHISLHRAFARRNSAFKALRLACTLQLWNRHRMCETCLCLGMFVCILFHQLVIFFRWLHLEKPSPWPLSPPSPELSPPTSRTQLVLYKKFQLLEDAPLLDQWHHIRPLVAQRVTDSCTGRNLVKALRVKHRILDWNTK